MQTRIGRLCTVENTQTKPSYHEAKSFTAVWVIDENGNDMCLFFSLVDIMRANMLAEKHKEDMPKRSLLSKLID